MKKRNYIRPAGKPITSRLREWVIGAVLMVVIALLGAVLLIEWFAGCGETYIDANGERHAYECVFIPQPK